jgi:hypothetical protein
MAAKRKRKARQNGEAITKAHKAVRMAKDGKNPSKANVNARANAKWETVEPRNIIPKTHEQLWKAKTPKQKQAEENIKTIYKDRLDGVNKVIGRFPITELMEKPIKYSRGQ